jgi:hypothetical protein
MNPKVMNMSIKAGHSTPLLHAAEIERSIDFYERLGFATIATDGCQPIGWARLHCEGGALMFLRTEEPLGPPAHPFMLYMYTPDLAGLRAQLAAGGLEVPQIKFPDYMPSGELSLKDPDGNTVLIGHWGEKEQREWEKHHGK